MKSIYFKDINLNDSFFDSLKEDYPNFSEWFKKKGEEQAFIHTNDNKEIDGFLYLKLETDETINILGNDDESICLPAIKRLKVGTFKINAHGTKLGDLFMGKIVRFATKQDVEEVYATIFDKHQGLIKLFEANKFVLIGRSHTKSNNNDREGYYFRKEK